MTVLEMCLNVFVLEIHTYIITMNQPPSYYITTSIIMYFVVVPLIWPDERSSSVAPFLYLAFIVVIHITLRYRSEKDMLHVYIRKTETKAKLI